MATFNNTAVPRILAAMEPFGVSFAGTALIQVVAMEPAGVSFSGGAMVQAFAAEPFTHAGSLMPAEHPSPRFTMRAYKTTPTTGYVYWEVDTPDLTGQFSGYLPSELTDIVIYHECCTRNDDSADI